MDDFENPMNDPYDDSVGGNDSNFDYDGTPYEHQFPYSICYNESVSNFTMYSIYCNNSFLYPAYDKDSEENLQLQQIVSIVVPILFGIIFIVGLIGNSLVVIVVACNQQMRNTTNILIINLAVADLLFIIFCVPFTATDYVFNGWIFGELWCKTVQYLIVVTAYVSVYTLVIMSVDRFLAVVYPVASISMRTERNTYLAITITWIIIVLSCLPAFPAHGLYTYQFAEQNHTSCTFLESTYNHAAFQIIFMLTSYVIPLTTICFLYFGMLFRLWKTSTTGASRHGIRGKKRVTRMIVIVVGVFAVCWLPIQTVLLLKTLLIWDTNDWTVALQIASHVLGYMNSCVNPILYAFLGRDFRTSFTKVIQCKFCLQCHPGFSSRGRGTTIPNGPMEVECTTRFITNPPELTVQISLQSSSSSSPSGSGPRDGDQK